MSWSEATSQKLAEHRQRFRELVQAHRELCDKSVRVFAHPEATDEQILEVAKAIGRTRNQLVAMRGSLADVHFRKGMTAYGNAVVQTKL